MPFKILCSSKTAGDWAGCGLFLTEVEPRGRNIQFKLAVSNEAAKVHFYKKDALPEAVAELLQVICDFLFRRNHPQARTTLGVRAILQAFSPLSRWVLSRDDESADFALPPLAVELGEELSSGGSLYYREAAADFTNLLPRIYEDLHDMTNHRAKVARWAITHRLLAWPHYPHELRYGDLDLSIDLPELKGLSTFSKLKRILCGDLEGIKATWKKKLEDNLFKWKVRDYGKKKGWGLEATTDLPKDSYIAIYGGTIFATNDPPRVQTHVLHFEGTRMEFAINGYNARDLTKIAQGALANDGRNASNSRVVWVNQCSSSTLSHLSRVPILRLSKDISEGTEIVYRYSPNSQYPAAIDYEE